MKAIVRGEQDGRAEREEGGGKGAAGPRVDVLQAMRPRSGPLLTHGSHPWRASQTLKKTRFPTASSWL